MGELNERFYNYLILEDEPRACKAIPAEACTHVPKNFTLNIANGSLTKLAERIISPNLTLAWMMDFFGASATVIGALVPVKDAASLLPQLAVSGTIRSFAIRKNFWVVSGLVQALAWLAAAAHIFFGNEETIPIVLLILLGIFSLASGVASIAYQDVIGKTIPKNSRGQMLSYRSTFGGVLSLIAGVVLVFFIQGEADKTVYGFMFLFASILWFMASILFYMIVEESGATQGGRNPLQEISAGVKLIKEEANFRNFLITRALLMAVPLLQPFYVLVIKDIDDSSWSLLGYLIIVNGLANIVSSPFWGRIADQSSTRLMRISASIAIGGGAFALLFYFASDWNLGFYAFLPIFFINGIAYSGARLSRKTYLVDYAPEEERPTYVSVANTFIGLFTVVAAGFGVVAQLFGLPAQIIFFMSLLVVAIVLSFRLQKV